MKPDFLRPESYAAAAWMLKCDPAAIQAVAEVEAGSMGAFNDDDSPVILYEPHVFSRLTDHKHDGARVKGHDSGEEWIISRRGWAPGTYGPNSIQHTKLQAAALIDRESALMSCSWGLFQILGVNHRQAGFRKVQDLVNAAYEDVDAHLRMFVMFIVNDSRLLFALQRQAWTMFAKAYNGPSFAQNRYDTRMRDAYQRIKGQA